MRSARRADGASPDPRARRATTLQRRVALACLVGLAGAAGAVACGGGDDDDRPSGEGSSAAEGEGASAGGGTTGAAPADEASVAAQRALAGTRVHLDLLALAHLADVDHHGLYMDFGTPARMHFTMGRWHSGFLRDVTAGERDFTRIGTDARAWFHLDRPRAATMRVRGRAVGSSTVVVYLNGQPAGQIRFSGTTVEDVDVPIEASALRAGENGLMLRAATTQTVEGEAVAAEIDAIWWLPGEVPAGELSPPRYRALVEDVAVGGASRRAVVLAAPSTIRWYAEVPEGGRLALGFGAPGAGERTIRVTVTPEGGEARVLHEGAVGAAWQDRVLELEGLAGQVVRVEVAAEGEGRVALSGPAIVVPLPDAPLAEAQARNVVVLLIDTLRASKLRVYNPRSRVRTPTLDAFAAEAAVFEQAQSPENWTKPSVASILTSLTPMTHNTKEQSSSLPQSALMLSEVLQQNGFTTGSFIANGYVSDRFGFHQGWDHYTNYIRENRSTEAQNVFREALAWIRANRDRRFFAYIQTIDPHVPYDPPDEIVNEYHPGPYTGPIRPRSTGNQLEDIKAGRLTPTPADIRRLEALHDGEITYHDREMATFVAGLRELGLYDDLVFVVTSDHGEEFNEHGSFGHGHSVFQELLHVPFIVRWPNVIEPRRIAPTVSTLDIAPTVLEAAGVAIPEEFEGQSLLATARGQLRAGPAIAFSDKLDDRRVATAAGYKLVVRGNLTWALFNLRTDPGEQRQIDSGARHPIALRYLRGLYGQHLGATNRGNWLHAGTGGESRVLPQAESQIDAELCRQLRALGYVDARCDAL
ncbi:MAG: sulfatase [Sandaracinaceae bacterium]|nr:sulfatase [Sandaracinaceae bacterium]